MQLFDLCAGKGQAIILLAFEDVNVGMVSDRAAEGALIRAEHLGLTPTRAIAPPVIPTYDADFAEGSLGRRLHPWLMVCFRGLPS